MAKDDRARYFYLPRELSSQILSAAHVGDKGHHLVRLMALKARVPRFGLLSVDAFDDHVATKEIQEAKNAATAAFQKEKDRSSLSSSLSCVVENAVLPIRLREAVDALVDAYTERDLLAVRASVAGDLHEVLLVSGHTDTLLAVRGKEAVRDAVAKCFASAFSKHVMQLRHEHGLDPFATRMGLVVQRMIEADVSGSSASLDVNQEDIRGPEILVEATFGLCGGMTNGSRIDLDLYRIRRPLLASDELDDDAQIEHDVVEKKAALFFHREHEGTSRESLDEEKQKVPALSDSQIRQVASQVLQLENELGRPISVDFAFVGRLVHLLQLSILEQPLKRVEGHQERTFSEQGLARDGLGPSTPLSLSVAKGALSTGISQRKTIECETNDETSVVFPKHLFGIRDSSLYLNEEAQLKSTSLLASQPGEYSERSIQGWQPFSSSRRLRKLAAELQLEADEHEFRIRRGLSISGPSPIQDADTDHLLVLLDEVLHELGWVAGHRWELDAILDEAIPYLKKFLEHFYPAAPSALCEDLLATTSSTHILDFTLELQRLSSDLLANASLRRRFEDSEKLSELAELFNDEQTPIAFRQQFAALLARRQDRPICAAKIEAPSLGERKDLLVAWLLAEVRHPAISVKEAQARAAARRQRAEYLVGEVMGKSRLWGIVKRSAIALSLTDGVRTLIFVREQGHALRKKLYGLLRDIFISLGHRLYEHQLLEQSGDVWFLSIDEVTGLLDGSALEGDLKVSITERKRRMKKTARSIPSRWKTSGLVSAADTQVLEEIRPHELEKSGRFSPGVVTGRLRFLQVHADGRGLQFESHQIQNHGGIVVLPQLDLGLLPTLLRADAIVVARGNPADLEVQVMRGLGIPVVQSSDALELAAATLPGENGKGAKVDGTTNELLLLDDKELEKLEKAKEKNKNEILREPGSETPKPESLCTSEKESPLLAPEKTQIVDLADVEEESSMSLEKKDGHFAALAPKNISRATSHESEENEDADEEPVGKEQSDRQAGDMDSDSDNVDDVKGDEEDKGTPVPRKKGGFMAPSSRTQLVEELIDE
ncbi:MAG: hypothetical protein GY822_29285 [Deltaproteobacteria bacterium]|nr:hypothetical protein [Deltaproteobacteria bacterium]